VNGACGIHGRDNVYMGLMGNPEEGDHLEDTDIYKRVLCSGSFLGMWLLGSLGMRYDKYILMGLKGQYFRIGGGWS
jgi:hypothetical protein